MSFCHLSTFYLSYKEVWKPCGMTWHFVIRLIVFPAGSSPSNLSHTQHFTTAPRPFVIFWIYGSVRTGHQRGKRIHLQDNESEKKQKQTKSHRGTVEEQAVSALCISLFISNCSHAIFSSPIRSVCRGGRGLSQLPKLSKNFCFLSPSCEAFWSEWRK